MVKICFLSHDGKAFQVDVKPGVTLMEAAYRNDISGVLGACGGNGGCATCHVYVDREWHSVIDERSARETRTLRYALETNEESRLACYIKVSENMEGLMVRVPGRQF